MLSIKKPQASAHLSSVEQAQHSRASKGLGRSHADSRATRTSGRKSHSKKGGRNAKKDDRLGGQKRPAKSRSKAQKRASKRHVTQRQKPAL